MDRDVRGAFGVSGGHKVPHVVVVDPHFEHYAPLAASARLGKLEIHFRSSGADAMKLVRRQRVDAWLVATDLDDMAGIDFVELLRGEIAKDSAADFSPAVRVAMVGSGAAGGEMREAIEAGADAALPKPITFSDLEALLGVASLERPELVGRLPGKQRAFITLPVGVGAAIVAIAVLMMS